MEPSPSDKEHAGGYDVEFVDKEPNDVTCCICLYVLNEPMQAEGCGHRFCKTCVENLQKTNAYMLSSIVCPEDRTTTKIFQDKGKEREILNLHVICKNSKIGCKWTNELRQLNNHLDIECQYETVSCTNTECQESFQRERLPKHLKTECSYRNIRCQFCSIEHQAIKNEDHHLICDQYPCKCEACDRDNIPRNKMENHVSEECPETLHPCQYTDIGCDGMFNKAAMLEHLNGTNQSHFHIAVKRVREQCEEIESQSKRIKLQSQAIIKLNDKLNTISKQPKFSGILLWELPNFYEMLRKSKVANESLYKHVFAIDGYKLKVELRLNGDRLSRNRISVYIKVVSGPFDDTLEWPMKAYISFSVVGADNVNKNILGFHTDQNDDTKKEFLNPSLTQSMGYGYQDFILHKNIPQLLIGGKIVLKICAIPK